MRINLILALILMAGCGKEVNLSNSKLENTSLITEGEAKKLLKSGVLLRMSSTEPYDRIEAEGKLYKVSIYSAHNPLEFIAAKPLGSSTNVTFKGKIISEDILLEEIK